MSFDLITSIARKAYFKEFLNPNLILKINCDSSTREMVSSIESAGFIAVIKNLDLPTTPEINSFNIDGCKKIQLNLKGVNKGDDIFVQKISDLFLLNDGKYLYEKPRRLYIVDVDYLSLDDVDFDDIVCYENAIKFVKLLEKISDMVKDDEVGVKNAIFLSTTKLEIPLKYSLKGIRFIKDKIVLDKFIDAIDGDSHKRVRHEITKRLLLRFLQHQIIGDRLDVLFRKITEFQSAFNADYDLYVREFDFGEFREAHLNKAIDYVVKIDAVTTDSLNKLLAIPIAQGILVSQIKKGEEYYWVNIPILVAAIIFSIISLMLVFSFISSLNHIKDEVLLEEGKIISKNNFNYLKIKPSFDKVKSKICYRKWIYSSALIILTLIGLILNFLIFIMN